MGDIMDLRGPRPQALFYQLYQEIEEQKRQLVEAKGPGTATEKETNDK